MYSNQYLYSRKMASKTISTMEQIHNRRLKLKEENESFSQLFQRMLEIYQQNLVAQVRDVLTRQILGKTYQITINNIEYLFEDVFRDFNLSEQSTIEKSPLSHFRVNLSIVLPESCPVPLLPSISCFLHLLG